MKLFFTQFWTVLLTVILFSCSSDDDRMKAPGGDVAEVYVSVTLAMNKGEATRASVQAPSTNPSLGMENAETYEDYIPTNDVRLLLFDQDDKFKEEVNILFNVDGAWMGSLSSITQEDLDAATSFHMVALCNCKGTLATSVTPSEGLTLDELIEAVTFSGYSSTFTANLTSGNANDARIPMWGICTTAFEKSGNITHVNINVLRSMAKVRVALGGDAMAKFKLQGARLNIANTDGYLAAQNNQAYTRSNDNKKYSTNWNYVYSNTDYHNGITLPSIPTNSTTIGDKLNFSFVTEDDEKSYYVIYIPEYKNLDGNKTVQTPATIELTITDEADNAVTDSKGNNYQLHFADYSNGASPTAPQWDIIRNDIYDYTITKIEAGLQVQLKVAKWAEYKHPTGVVM